jgi:hypothetical protein
LGFLGEIRLDYVLLFGLEEIKVLVLDPDLLSVGSMTSHATENPSITHLEERLTTHAMKAEYTKNLLSSVKKAVVSVEACLIQVGGASCESWRQLRG